MNLSNNTILITGGTSGIGSELAIQLREKGNRVIVLGKDQSKISHAKNIGLETIQCDLRKFGDIEKAVMKIESDCPELNLLINNAGIQYNYRIEESALPFDKIEDEILVNLTAQIKLTQLLIPILSTNKNAKIINTTSALGAYPKTDGIIYSVTKAAFRNFTTGLRNNLKPLNIKVLELIPPVTETNMTANRSGKKMAVTDFVKIALPQVERERNLITTNSIRLFLCISFFFPKLAGKIINKQ